MTESNIFPDNRFIALDQFLNLLGFKKFEWQSLFRILGRADSGFLEYRIGNLEIEVNVGSCEPLDQNEDICLRIIFRIVKNNVEKSAIYTYKISELEALGKEKKIKIENFKIR
ncbi:MAG: hypothetical protein P8X91_01355 [Candidatus Bathyarchaeota archaeon]